MTLLDFIVIAVVLLVLHFAPEAAFLGIAFTVTLALIVERLLKGERL